MKARVKATGEIIDVIQVGTKTHLFDLNNVEFIDAPEDYWTHLEHQYAGMAMQGVLAGGMENTYEFIAEFSINQATALINKLKEKEERK